MHRSTGYALPVGLWLGGLAAFAVVVTMNAVFAAKYGGSDFERNVSMAIAIVIDSATVLLAAAFGATLSARRWLASLTSGVFLCLVLAISGATAVGYFGIARLAPAEAARVNAERKAEAAERVADRLTKQADIWQTQVITAKPSERKMLIEESRASIRAILDVPKADASEVMPDPFGAVVAKWSGVNETTVQAIFMGIMAGVLVLLKVVMIGLGSFLWPAPIDRRSVAEEQPEADEQNDEEAGDTSSANANDNNVVRPEFGDRHPYQSDTVAAWIAHGQLGDDVVEDEYNALYDRYSAWCAAIGLSRVGPRQFGGHLLRLGCKRSRNHSGAVFYSIPVREAQPIALAA